MAQKPRADQELSFRRLAAMSGSREGARVESVPDKVAKPKITTPKSDEARRNLYRQATDYLSKVMEAVRQDKPFSLDPGYPILERIVDIRTPMDALFLKAIHSDESYDFVVNHSVNVAIYAVNMAETLGYSRERQIEMGMVGLFHDIGMAKIPEEVIYKKDKLNDREFHLIKERPKLGYQILRQVGEDYAYLAESALQIYERIDGSGYPRGLKEDEIHEYAQIIGLVDMYEALIHTRPQREKILHYYAVKEIIRSGKRQFQQRYLKALLNTFSIFPLHSNVKLNSNAIGRVIQTYRDQPMRPKLQIVYDSQRKRVLTERFINLPEHSLLYITDAVSEEDLLSISEESYLLTKPAAFDSYESAEERAGKSEPIEKIGGLVESTGADGKDAGRKSAVAPSSKLRAAILAVALILIAGGGIWQFVSTPNLETTSLPAAVEKKSMAAADADSQRLQNSGEVPVSALKPPAAVKDEKPGVDIVIPREQRAPNTVPAVVSESPSGDAGKAMTSNAVPSVPDSEMIGTVEPQVPHAALDTVDPPAPAYPFSIKLAHFRTQNEAAAATAAYIASEDVVAYWVKVDLGAQGIWYRVFGGHFESADTANGFLKEHGLTDGIVKTTKYANWIGASEDAVVVQEKAAEITASGFSPYMIQRDDGKFSLYVGAFYTKAGAEVQYRDLTAKGFQNQIVER